MCPSIWCSCPLPADEPVAAFPRVYIHLGQGARASVIESYVGIDAQENLTCAVTEIIAAEGARCDHYRVQREHPRSYHVGRLSISQARDSEVTSFSIACGARLSRQDIAVRLEGEGASVALHGLYLGDGRRHVDHHTRIDHLLPHTHSEEHYKGVLDGRSRGVFNGTVVVHPDAQKSEAHQSNHNLLLSGEAEIDTKPELQIHADDVDLQPRRERRPARPRCIVLPLFARDRSACGAGDADPGLHRRGAGAPADRRRAVGSRA